MADLRAAGSIVSGTRGLRTRKSRWSSRYLLPLALECGIKTLPLFQKMTRRAKQEKRLTSSRSPPCAFFLTSVRREVRDGSQIETTGSSEVSSTQAAMNLAHREDPVRTEPPGGWRKYFFSTGGCAIVYRPTVTISSHSNVLSPTSLAPRPCEETWVSLTSKGVLSAELQPESFRSGRDSGEHLPD